MLVLRSLSIRTKLLIGFGLVLTLTAILGAVLIAEVGTVSAGGNYLGENALPSVRVIGQVRAGFSDYQSAELFYAMDDNPQLRKAIDKARSAAAASVAAGLQDYKADLTNGEDRTEWTVVVNGWRTYLAKTAVLQQLANRGESAQTIPLFVKSYPMYLALVSKVNKWLADNARWAATRLVSNRSSADTAREIGLGLILLTVLLGAVVALIVSRSIKRPIDTVLSVIGSLQEQCITSLRRGMQALADGDLTQRLSADIPEIENPAGDEVGQLAQAVNEIASSVKHVITDYNGTAERLAEVIGRMADGAEVVSTSSRLVEDSSEESGRVTGQVAQAVGEIAEGAERQVRIVEAALGSASQVASAAATSAEHAQATAEAAHGAQEIVRQGMDSADQANIAMLAVRESSSEIADAIRSLESKSDEIGEIVHTITGLAEQTNLLALNAAIEAARAGDQGRGFAVVAEEVRKLAEESQLAAGEISKLISAIQTDTRTAVTVVQDGAERTEHGTAVVEQTREAFLQIGSAVGDISTRIQQIAEAAGQVAASTETMRENISEVAVVAEGSSASTEEVAASTEQTSASAQQIAASAQELAGSAEELNQLVALFKTAA